MSSPRCFCAASAPKIDGFRAPTEHAMLRMLLENVISMPLPAAAVAAYSAIVNALPAAAPVIGAAAVGFGIVASHTPGAPDTVQLKGTPEVAAHCMKGNVAALKTRLAASVQPLYGTETMGVVVKRGSVGDPLVAIVIQEAGSGSRAEFRPLTPPDQQPDVIAKIIAGC